MLIHIFVDDERDYKNFRPSKAEFGDQDLWIGEPAIIAICRSPDEFLKTLDLLNSEPDVNITISMDHDLGHAIDGARLTSFLLLDDPDKGLYGRNVVAMACHSQNSVGTKNIRGYIQDLFRLKGKK